MLARAVSILFVLTILFSFVSVRYASFALLAFVIVSISFSFLNGNKNRLFLASLFLFCVVFASFFIHFKYIDTNENKIKTTNTVVVDDNNLKQRLLNLRQRMQNEDSSSADLLTYMYDTITLAESLATSSVPSSYLDLGFTYETASMLGIDSAKQKAVENFAIYCKLEPKDKTCELVQ